MCMNIEDCLQL